MNRGGGAGIDAPGGLGHDQQLRALQDLAANNELLQVASREATCQRISAGRFDIKLVKNLFCIPADTRPVDESVADKAHAKRRGQETVLHQTEIRNCRLPDPFFWHKDGAKLAPGHGTHLAGIAREDFNGACLWRTGLA